MTKRKRQLFVVAACLIVGAACVIGLLPHQRSSNAPIPSAARRIASPRVGAFYPEVPLPELDTSSSISGSIRSHGQPIANAVVSCWLSPEAAGVYRNLAPRLITTSDKRGAYKLEDLDPGAYDVTFHSEGKQPDYARRVIVRAGEVSVVDADLRDGGHSISGTVCDFVGGEIAGARITAMRMLGDSTPPLLFETVSESDGTYRMSLMDGNYVVAARAPGFAVERKSVVVASATKTVFSLIPTGRLTGHVVEQQSLVPIAAAEVTVIAEHVLASYLPVRSDETGSFVFDELPPGRYNIWARAGQRISSDTQVTVGLGERTTEIRLVISDGASLVGSVTNANGVAIPDARVRAQTTLELRDRAVVGSTDPSGRYRVSGLPIGPLAVRVEAAGHVAGERRVTVAPGTPTTLDVRLESASTLSGRLSASGQDLREAVLTLLWKPTATGDPIRFQVNADSNGEFAFRDLAAGSGAVTATIAGYGSTRVSVPELRPGQVRRVELQIARNQGSWVEGVVHASDGHVVQAVSVMSQQASTDGSAYSYVVSTDGSGHFRVGPFGDGEVSLLATANASPTWALAVPSTDRDRATVHVAEAETKTGVTLEVQDQDGSLTGEINDENGAGISDALVTVAPEIAGAAMRRGSNISHSVTDSRGKFAVSALKPGKYTIWASRQDYADTQRSGVSTNDPLIALTMGASIPVSGQVIYADGKPAHDYILHILQTPSAAGGVHVGISDFPSRRVHDELGEFVVAGLGQGAYDLFVRTADGKTGTASFRSDAKAVRVVVQEPAGEQAVVQ